MNVLFTPSQACSIAAYVLLLYDTQLMFGDEVKYVWNKRPRLGDVLYLVARYSRIIHYTLILYLNLAISDLDSIISINTCSNVMGVDYFTIFFADFGMLALELARAYALSGRNLFILFGLGIFLLASMACGFGSASISWSCAFSDVGDIVPERLVASQYILMIIFEFGVLMAVVWYLYRLHISMRKADPGFKSLVTVCLHQNVIQFGIIFTYATWVATVYLLVGIIQPDSISSIDNMLAPYAQFLSGIPSSITDF